MSREKQIEEMAKVLESTCDETECNHPTNCDVCQATRLYNAGYRKHIYGVWEIVKYDPFVRNYRCSSCKKESVARFQFFPNCGAKMKGEQQ